MAEITRPLIGPGHVFEKPSKAFEKYISSVVGDIRNNRNRSSSIMTYSVESPCYIPTVPIQSVPVETCPSSNFAASTPTPDLPVIGTGVAPTTGTGLGSGLVPGLSNGFSGSQVHIISSSSPVPTQPGPGTSYYGSTSQLTVSPTAAPFIPKANYPNGK